MFNDLLQLTFSQNNPLVSGEHSRGGGWSRRIRFLILYSPADASITSVTLLRDLFILNHLHLLSPVQEIQLIRMQNVKKYEPMSSLTCYCLESLLSRSPYCSFRCAQQASTPPCPDTRCRWYGRPSPVWTRVRVGCFSRTWSECGCRRSRLCQVRELSCTLQVINRW